MSPTTSTKAGVIHGSPEGRRLLPARRGGETSDGGRRVPSFCEVREVIGLPARLLDLLGGALQGRRRLLRRRLSGGHGGGRDTDRGLQVGGHRRQSRLGRLGRVLDQL